MAKKIVKNESVLGGLDEIFAKIKDETTTDSSESSIPNIIDFCYSKRYLYLPQQNIKLYPFQEIILKAFYRKQKGNEHVTLTKEELEMLKKNGQQMVIDKYYSEDLFRELVLVLGRRAGKDFLCSIMAAYEAMKLLEIPGGCPYKYYGLAPGNPIYILTVATS